VFPVTRAAPPPSSKTSVQRSVPHSFALDATKLKGSLYSIRVTSRLTSIELDILRMWERRYGFPHPERTRGGSRVYTESDVETLKLIRLALRQGYRPNEVVGKPPNELKQLIALVVQSPTLATHETPTIASLLGALSSDDLGALRAQLRQASLALGPKRFVTEVAQPLSVRVGEYWAESRLEVRHEHLLTECLSWQLRLLMAAHEEQPGAPRVLLSTLPNERHGLGLEMVELYLAVSHVTPLLLGVDTPPEQIVEAAREYAVDAVGLLVTAASDLKATSKHVRWLLAQVPRRVSIWIGGGTGRELDIHDEALQVIDAWSDLDSAIAILGRETNQKT
jgi:MerR family transcriptional regulator, light-induced transcriptional regulator